MSDKFRIARRQFTIPTVAGTTASIGGVVNGLLMQVKIKTPVTDSAATVTLDILDAEGDVAYTKATVASNTTSITLLTGDVRVPLAATQTLRLTFSATQSTLGVSTIITLSYDQG